MLAAALTAMTLLASTATTDMNFVATLNGTNNVPPLSGVTASGTATLVLNAAQTELSFHIEFSGLGSSEIASHIHVGGPRENGGVAFALPLGSPKDGVWNISPEHVTNLLDGRLYINIHTEVYVTGEIRGNIVLDPVATEPTTWGRFKSKYLTR